MRFCSRATLSTIVAASCAAATALVAVAAPAPVAAFDGTPPVISEVMFNPASAEDDWEWIELYNPGTDALDLAGWVVDDGNNTAVAAPNIAAGSVPAGGSAILFNVDDVTAADFEAAWGTDINLVAVTGWSAMGLNNGGDTIGLWETAEDHLGDQAAQANAVLSVTYDGASGNGTGSAHLTDLADQQSFAASTDGLATPVGVSYTATAEGGNSGVDVGSPGGTFTADGDVLFTQYIEGSSNNKALEIANTTGIEVDLSGYVLERYTNGSPTVSASVDLSGILADGDVYVIANGSSNPDILAVTDLQSGVASWNGDDAIVLRRSVAAGGAVVDSIGQVGFDPGTQWGDATLGTLNNTLCRIDSATIGDTDTSDAFDPSLEWEAKGEDNTDGLGELGCDAAPAPGAVIFTQYIEGSSNNKALEVANLGTAAVDLSTYTVERYSNGGVVPALIPLSGSLETGDVFVISNPNANTDILAVTDLENGNASWNGDDALVLRDGDGNVADSIGRVGEDPGDEWGDATVGTQNETLCRVDLNADIDPSDEFDPATQWEPQGQDNIDGLGNIGCDLQPVGDLIFTQYVEGSSNNKALEIANFTGAPIDLGGYTIEVYFNGNTTVGTTIVLDTVTLAADDVYVVANTSSSTAILGVTDQTSGSATWNGDDAIVLRNASGGTVADSIGQVGYDPGTEWGGNPLGTQDDTLCRNADIGANGGDTDPSDPFDPAAQWASLGQDNLLGLGEVGCVNTSAGVCGDGGTTLISTIQGDGIASPLVGSTVIIEGIVVATFQGDGQIGGFYVQEEDADVDGDAATSEGISVFDFTPVNVGDSVRIRGVVEEFFDLTQVGNASDVVTCTTSTGTATPVTLALPYPEGFDLESIEGMAVDIAGPLVVTDTFNAGRFGEVRVSIDEPLVNPTQAAEPGPEANAVGALNDRSQVLLDDGRTGSELADVAYFGSDDTLRRGDRFDGTLSTVLSFGFGAYRFQPRFDPTVRDLFTRVDERPVTPPDVGGDLTFASFNVLNYFTTLDDRGADTEEELARQRAKIVAAVTQLDADVVGLIEVENNDAAIADLVAGFNEVAGAGTYEFIDTGVIGTDAIKVGFVYQPASVTPVGDFAVLDSSVDPRFVDTKNRPALVQTFEDPLTGERVTVAINHFKSKGSDCDELGDPDTGDEQGNCNLTRTSAAEALVDFLADDPTDGGTDNRLILGDLNAYPNEDPIDAFEAGGYIDLLSQFAPDAQSFVFFGEGGRLDHALVSPALLDSVTGAAEWSINAAEPRALDYNVGGSDGDNPPGLYQPDPFRSSDHDPVLVGLTFEQPAPQALFVVGKIFRNGRLFSGDQELLEILEGIGAEVLVIEDDDVAAGVEDGRDIVVISSSVNSRKVGEAFTDSIVPVVSAEGYLFDDLGFNRAGFFRNGVTLFRYQDFDIADASHSLAAGYDGSPDVVSSRRRFAFSRPEGDVQVVGSVGSVSVLFGYEAGAQMSGDNVAPARRVGLFADYGASTKLTAAGEDIVTASFNWALGID